MARSLAATPVRQQTFGSDQKYFSPPHSIASIAAPSQRASPLIASFVVTAVVVVVVCFSALPGRSKKKDRCLKETAFPLAETEDCPCDDFLSQPHGNWSACVLPVPTAPPGALRGWGRYHRRKECGPGLRFKALACVDRSGRLVDPTLCTHSGTGFNPTPQLGRREAQEVGRGRLVTVRLLVRVSVEVTLSERPHPHCS